MIRSCIDCGAQASVKNKNTKRCLACSLIVRRSGGYCTDETRTKISLTKRARMSTSPPRICSCCSRKIGKRNKTERCPSCAKMRGSVGDVVRGVVLLGYLRQNEYGYGVWRLRCHCGREFDGVPSRFRTGLARSCGCSRIPHWKELGKKQTGEGSPVWISDRTKTAAYYRDPRFLLGSWQYLSRKVKKERNFTCELTGVVAKKPSDVQTHHKQPVCLCPHLTLDRKNLVVILKNIHKEFHRRYGSRASLDQWEHFSGEVLERKNEFAVQHD